MIPGQRGPDRTPGDFYFDPDVPDRDQVHLTAGDWQAVATHVWTGTGWARLSAATVRLVPVSAAVVTEATGWPA